jgi:peptidoglycan/LPS O-acetylase OafA/YrhL
MTKPMRNELLVLMTLVLVAAGYTTANLARGDLGPGFTSLTTALVLLVLGLVARRNESLRRELFATDERSSSITMFSAAWSGFAIFCALFVGYLIEVARGNNIEPYYWATSLYIVLFILIAAGRRLRH